MDGEGRLPDTNHQRLVKAKSEVRREVKVKRYISSTYKCRVHAGFDALVGLPRELDRLGVRRVLVVCSNSVAHKTELIVRIQNLIGERSEGIYDKIGRHATVASVQAAATLAKTLDVDCLVAVGAGSVLMATRIVAILARESRPIGELITQYPENAEAHSPKLNAPKPIIINVLTAPTLAQNRSGGALKDPTADHRLEFFDPKTRPSAIFWDSEALMTAPALLSVDTGLTIFWFTLMTRAAADVDNVLSFGDRVRAFELAAGALPRMGDPVDVKARIEVCAAAYLLNRDEDCGNFLAGEHWIVKVCYALGSGIFMLRDDIGPGISYAILTAAAIRQFGDRNPRVVAQMGALLQHTDPNHPVASPADVAKAFEDFLERNGFVRRLRDLGVAKEALATVRNNALKNFNADRSRELVDEIAGLDKVLLDAW